MGRSKPPTFDKGSAKDSTKLWFQIFCRYGERKKCLDVFMTQMLRFTPLCICQTISPCRQSFSSCRMSLQLPTIMSESMETPAATLFRLQNQVNHHPGKCLPGSASWLLTVRTIDLAKTSWLLLTKLEEYPWGKPCRLGQKWQPWHLPTCYLKCVQKEI